MGGKLIIPLGGSGSGKTVLSGKILSSIPDAEIMAADTTREPRSSDIPGEFNYRGISEYIADFDAGKFFSSIKLSPNPLITDDYYAMRWEYIHNVLAGKTYVRSLTPEVIPIYWNTLREKVVFFYIVDPPGGESEIRERLLDRDMTMEKINQRRTNEKDWMQIVSSYANDGIPIHFLPSVTIEDTFNRAWEILK